MVNFGTYLTSFRNPAWAAFYVDYEELKARLYALEKAVAAMSDAQRVAAKQSDMDEGRAFEKQLDDDLDKINRFYNSKLSVLQGIFDRLKEHLDDGNAKNMSEGEREKIKDEFHALYVELSLLRDYSSLNYTGFSKILKKHDKTLPEFKMKRDFFKNRIDTLPVFGILDAVYKLQAETVQSYSEKFAGFNRLDTEISFGEALAKATSEMQQESGSLRKRLATRQAQPFAGQPLGIDSAADHLLMAEYMQGYRRDKDPNNVVSSALWQRARVTMMAVQALRKEPVIMPILVSVFFIFLGGCGQAFCLEYMVKVDPGAGSTITFFQFLFVALEGLKDYLTIDSSKPSLLGKVASLRLKPLQIPLKYHVGCVLMSWLAAILSSWAYSYKISVPFHMIFKSSILLVNMTIGVLIMGRRYSFGQVLSVLLVTLGVMLSTYASLPNRPQANDAAAQATLLSWLFGLSILALSLVFTGFLGILQDLAYRNYGQHWKEALFYAHFLGLPLFLSLLFEVWEHVSLWTKAHPFMWVVLALNTLSSVIGVKGMYSLTGLTSSLTGNLTITVRKFLSLILSVVYFNNEFTLSHWSGATLVLLGTVLYTGASQQKQAAPSPAQQAPAAAIAVSDASSKKDK